MAHEKPLTNHHAYVSHDLLSRQIIHQPEAISRSCAVVPPDGVAAGSVLSGGGRDQEKSTCCSSVPASGLAAFTVWAVSPMNGLRGDSSSGNMIPGWTG